MPDPSFFELDSDPEWGCEARFFLDNEHRYTKMHRLLRDHTGEPVGKRILDLGACRGQLLARFDGSEAFGTEIVASDAERLRQRGVDVQEAYLEPYEPRLPYRDDSFDVVFAGEIIEHMVDTEGFLVEIARVLHGGGSVVLSTPNVLWVKNRVVQMLGRYPDALDYRLRYGRDFGHVRAFAPDLVRELLEDAGFDDIDLVGKRIGPVTTLTRLPGPLARALDRMADRHPELADHILAYGRKAA